MNPCPSILKRLSLFLIIIFSTCIFCGITNKKFTPELLDEHYWNQCPLLMRCTQCDMVVKMINNQAIEIMDLNSHLLNNCEYSKDFRPCPRCKQCIPLDVLREHTKNKSCKLAATEIGAVNCPLCHVANSSRDQLQNHLVSSCDKNSRGR